VELYKFTQFCNDTCAWTPNKVSIRFLFWSLCVLYAYVPHVPHSMRCGRVVSADRPSTITYACPRMANTPSNMQGAIKKWHCKLPEPGLEITRNFAKIMWVRAMMKVMMLMMRLQNLTTAPNGEGRPPASLMPLSALKSIHTYTDKEMRR
jgi:hypothetical protein